MTAAQLSEQTIYCPYCGEPISILLDSEEAGAEYVEDCQVCCRPIVMTVNSMGESVSVRCEDD